jgi:large subunit ribosomal protein L10Ae
MSKIDPQLLADSVASLLAFSAGETITINEKERKGKKRNFTETIEAQITLKNYDPRKDKRFNGTVKLPSVPRPNLRICVLANAVHTEQCQETNMPYRDVEGLKAFNKNAKQVKKFAKQYDAFLASDTLIKQIPKLLGPGLTKAGKFPTLIRSAETVDSKLDEIKATIKFQMKKVLCMNVAVANVNQDPELIGQNIRFAVNFLVSLLKKGWQNIKTIYIKSTMGPPFQVYF